MDRYAVIGNPIAHSRSPQIHTLFAQQTGQHLTYEAILAPIDGFGCAVDAFVASGGKGLNVTVPFKLEACELVDDLSPRARRTQAVNTLVVHTADGRLSGDNTDGVGLLRDLTRNHRCQIQGRRVLILGAGGAARGVLEPLLRASPSQLVIANRTVSRAVELTRDFSDLGQVEACGFEELAGERFDLIINGTSAGLIGEVPPIPEDVLRRDGWCYDMFYASQPTAFVLWGRRHGAAKSMDGLGMLVEQAAESFFIWRGVRPATAPVIKALSGSQ